MVWPIRGHYIWTLLMDTTMAAQTSRWVLFKIILTSIIIYGIADSISKIIFHDFRCNTSTFQTLTSLTPCSEANSWWEQCPTEQLTPQLSHSTEVSVASRCLPVPWILLRSNTRAIALMHQNICRRVVQPDFSFMTEPAFQWVNYQLKPAPSNAFKITLFLQNLDQEVNSRSLIQMALNKMLLFTDASAKLTWDKKFYCS